LADKIIAYTDGGSRGNPGPAAAAVVLTHPEGTILLAKGFFLGPSTNNVAEYTAVVKALEAAVEMKASEIELVSDSELLVRQLNGQYAVRSENLIPLHARAKRLLAQFHRSKVRHVTREHNTQADKLVNQALDSRSDVTSRLPDPAPSNQRLLRLGVLISGTGRTLLNLVECIRKGRLRATIPQVISSRADVAGVDKARSAGLQVAIVRKKDYPDVDAFSQRLVQELDAAKVDLVVQGGWLCLWKIPKAYENRVMNVHPALLPSFGGQGMWGHHVHEAVLAAGCKVSGCTVHFCTDQYDSGPIIVQRTCPVLDDDTPDTLAERVFAEECIGYPEAIRLFSEGRLVVSGGRVRVKS
jgi:formyltetrahydrofolate-dependent phosphoribosylglycinamide formyltransferase